MKITLIILLSGLFLCGCSRNQAGSSGSAIDRVQVGDTVWHNGPMVLTLHVEKRDGNSLEGVSLSVNLTGGHTSITSADTATLSTPPNSTDNKLVMITFHKGTMQSDSTTSMLGGDYPMTLHE